MTQTVFKYTVPVDDEVHAIALPRTALIQHVACQNYVNNVQFWAVTFPDHNSNKIERRFRVFGTGHEVPSQAIYVGTALAPYNLVWHLFEIPEEVKL